MDYLINFPRALLCDELDHLPVMILIHFVVSSTAQLGNGGERASVESISATKIAIFFSHLKVSKRARLSDQFLLFHLTIVDGFHP